MNLIERATERRGMLQLAATALAVVLVYCIGQQHAENMRLFLLGGALVSLGIPLGCITWPPSETGRHFTLPRAAFSGVASLAVFVLAVVIGHFFPDHPFVAPVLAGAGLLMIMFVQAP